MVSCPTVRVRTRLEAMEAERRVGRVGGGMPVHSVGPTEDVCALLTGDQLEAVGGQNDHRLEERTIGRLNEGRKD